MLLAACGTDPGSLLINDRDGVGVGAPPTLTGAMFGSPVRNANNISSTFGPRWKTGDDRYDFHLGIDYFDPLGTPVVAIGPGVVDGVYPEGSTQFPAGGNVVVVRHVIPPQQFHGHEVDRVFAVYLHLASFAVADGDTVTLGETVGTMGMTGDTEFVHLHFETRVQTECSLPYQTTHPEASCAQYGFDPHVHPYLFVPRNDDVALVTVHGISEPNSYRYVSTALEFDVIETDLGTIGFSRREGLEATSLDALDNFERGWIRIVPEPFTSDSTEIAYQLYFAEPIRYLEVRSVYGYGQRYE